MRAFHAVILGTLGVGMAAVAVGLYISNSPNETEGSSYKPKERKVEVKLAKMGTGPLPAAIASKLTGDTPIASDAVAAWAMIQVIGDGKLQQKGNFSAKPVNYVVTDDKGTHWPTLMSSTSDAAVVVVPTGYAKPQSLKLVAQTVRNEKLGSWPLEGLPTQKPRLDESKAVDSATPWEGFTLTAYGSSEGITVEGKMPGAAPDDELVMIRLLGDTYTAATNTDEPRMFVRPGSEEGKGEAALPVPQAFLEGIQAVEVEVIRYKGSPFAKTIDIPNVEVLSSKTEVETKLAAPIKVQIAPKAILSINGAKVERRDGGATLPRLQLQFERDQPVMRTELDVTAPSAIAMRRMRGLRVNVHDAAGKEFEGGDAKAGKLGPIKIAIKSMPFAEVARKKLLLKVDHSKPIAPEKLKVSAAGVAN